jgi:hypothetical protein
MKSHLSLIGPHLQAFFSEHLCNHKRASPQTIASCRDTFRLLAVPEQDDRNRTGCDEDR